jgi:hypothetical protein
MESWLVWNGAPRGLTVVRIMSGGSLLVGTCTDCHDWTLSPRDLLSRAEFSTRFGQHTYNAEISFYAVGLFVSPTWPPRSALSQHVIFATQDVLLRARFVDPQGQKCRLFGPWLELLHAFQTTFVWEMFSQSTRLPLEIDCGCLYCCGTIFFMVMPLTDMVNMVLFAETSMSWFRRNRIRPCSGNTSSMVILRGYATKIRLTPTSDTAFWPSAGTLLTLFYMLRRVFLTNGFADWLHSFGNMRRLVKEYNDQYDSSSKGPPKPILLFTKLPKLHNLIFK